VILLSTLEAATSSMPYLNSSNPKTLRTTYFLLAAPILTIVSFIIYYPGFFGVFLLDDDLNLKGLRHITGIYDWEGIISFSLNGITGSLGRPISLLTFALQSSAWPEHPYYFKLINYFIHLINGFLVFLLTRSILLLPSAKFEANQKTIFIYSLLISFVWLIHPIQVSTVLYTVQRMAELATFFSLLGMLGYLKSRALLNQNRLKEGYFLLTSTFCITMLLGVLSKENAILLCLYIILIEYLFFYPNTVRYMTLWRSIFLFSPLIILVSYLLFKAYPFLDTYYPYREYTAIERLITQPRVLLDYISSILFPRPQTFGLFNYEYQPSKSLFKPISTLTSLSLITALLFSSIIVRKKYPLLTFGILFFFSAHALESSIVNLELYFEHRNYLALLGLAIAGFVFLHILLNKLRLHGLKKGLYAIKIGNMLWVVLIVSITYQEVQLWNNPISQLSVWANEKPNDHRAQGYYGLLLTKYGFFKEAETAYKKGYNNTKTDLTIPILWMELQCFDEDIIPPNIEEIKARIPQIKYHHSTITAIDSIITLLDDNQCDYANINGLIEITEALLTSDKYQHPPTKQFLHILASKLFTHKKDHSSAIKHLEKAINIRSSIDIQISLTYNYYIANQKELFENAYFKVINYCESHPVKCYAYTSDLQNLKTMYERSNSTNKPLSQERQQ